MHELQVPTRRVNVEMTLRDGERFAGSLFAPESPYLSGDVEHLRAMLEDERRFVPFHAREPHHHTFVLNKAQIRWLTVPHDGSLLPEQHSPVCELVLEDGGRVSGRLVVETRRSSSRIADKLNRTGRFVVLSSDDAIRFVTWESIVRIVDTEGAWRSSTD